MDEKLISIIMVNYNTAQVTIEAINSVLHNESIKKIAYEIIIIDNNSSDDSTEEINKKYCNEDNVRLIELDMNIGFGPANNVGAKISQGKYLCFLNSDTISDMANYKKMLNLIEENEEVSILSCKLLNVDGTIQNLGFQFPTILQELKLNFLFWNFNFMKRIRFFKYKNKGIFKVDWVSGAFFLISKRNFTLLDGFDESIFMYAEDLDLGYRAFKKGMFSYIYDETEMIHIHGASSKKNDLNTLSSKIDNARNNYYYVVEKNNIFNKFEVRISKILFTIHKQILLFGKFIKKVIINA